MEKVTFVNTCAQGDLKLIRVSKLPEGARPLSAENGVFVVAHSESGHNHVIDALPNVQWYDVGDPMISYLEVIEATDATETLLRHLRSYDTHKTIVIPPGIFELRRQRGHTPEGWARIED